MATIFAPSTHAGTRMDLDGLLAETSLVAGWRDADWGPGDAWGSRVSAHQYRRLFRMLGRWAPPGATVLDWGSGSGRFASCLLSGGYAVTAFDLVRPPLIDHLQAAGGDRFRFAAAQDPVLLPFADEEFDVVTSVGVLEHVRETGGDEPSSLYEIRRVLRPGGVFVCYHFPNRFSWIDWAARHREGAHHHPFRYTARDIRRLTRQAGLELHTVTKYGMLPRNQAARLPNAISDTATGVALFDAADAALGRVLRPFCQNYAFVASKPS